MNQSRVFSKTLQLTLSTFIGAFLLFVLLATLGHQPQKVHADPIPPPEGYPKLGLSMKTVTPTLANTGGVTLSYWIEINNTGAYTADGVMLMDAIPANTTYNGDAGASIGNPPTLVSNTLIWTGTVGFDASAIISFSVTVNPVYSGTITNTAVITAPLIAEPVTVTAQTVVTDDPILSIGKFVDPAKPGANGLMTYTLQVRNQGQPAFNLPITVTDMVPVSTTLSEIGPDGFTNVMSDTITWTRNITLDLGQSTIFTFSVMVNDVPSGTVITNDMYWVNSSLTGISAGEPVTSTIVEPILELSKDVWPNPPGSNREMTYTLLLFNRGAAATNLVITDVVPAGTSYVSGGTEAGGVVTWNLGRLDTNESAVFTFTVYVSDVIDLPIVNDNYAACSAENICTSGEPLTVTVEGPQFEVLAILDPIAKKPGGGGGPVTPTLVVRNIGPGNAIDAQATLYFDRISVGANDLYVTPTIGTPPPFPDGPICGGNCNSYVWTGSISVGQVLSFTTWTGQSTIGGEEGTIYSTTIVITDALSNGVTEPFTDTEYGTITHYSNLIPTKQAPRFIGPGQIMTYNIQIWNSALALDNVSPPFTHTLTDTVPLSTTLIGMSPGGMSFTVGSRTVISWGLDPGELGTGATTSRWFVVQVSPDAVSGTQIVNDDYWTRWYEINASSYFSHAGVPVTTTVQEVGLIDSYKEVNPVLSLPGPDIVLTWTVHVVNSGPYSLTGVTVDDLLPWEDSTYLRDAMASSGQIISDIVSLQWQGDVGPFSEEVITLTVLVDDGFTGAITNTAVISHADLNEPITKTAVAYITDQPVLTIVKHATPDPVNLGEELTYEIRVVNLGQQATQLMITDTIPANTSYVPDSATASGVVISGTVVWNISVLDPGQARTLRFKVVVNSGSTVINADYGVVSAEGVSAVGPPVVTEIGNAGTRAYLPIVRKE